MRPYLLALGLLACKPDADDTGTPARPSDALVTTTLLEAGDPDCANGGTRLDVGLDDGDPGGTEDDGVLQAEEVDASTFVCADAPDPVHAVVTSTVELPKGDLDCPDGGHRVSWGLDDGLPSGTADDTVLQDGGIDDHTDLCLDPPAVPPTVDDVFAIPAETTAGTLVLDVSGGAGGPAGGRGGYLSVEAYAGPLQAAIIARPDATSAFVAPTPAVVVDLGAVPAEVTTDTALVEVDDDDTIPSGVYYRYGRLRIGEDEVTGLHVHPGVTLTMPQGERVLRFDADVHNEGTITTFVSGDIATDLQIECDDFVNAADALVDLRAKVRSGDLKIYAVRQTTSTIVNLGALRANGTTFPLPGQPGEIELVASADLLQHGDVFVRGGNSGNGSNPGTHGGEASLWSLGGTLSNAGTIHAEGGSGTVGAGGGTVRLAAGGSAGPRGDVSLSHGDLGFEPLGAAFGPGTLVHTGESLASAAPGASGIGGHGGDVTFQVSGHQLHIGGEVDVIGGAGTDGGGGGTAAAYLTPYLAGGILVLPEDLTVSAAIAAIGGTGTISSGRGGDVRIAADVSMTYGNDGWDSDPLAPDGTPLLPLATLEGRPLVVTLAGYGGGFELTGGAGTLGGKGGVASFRVDACHGTEPACAVPTLGERWLRFDVPTDVTGGDGSIGGEGGRFAATLGDTLNTLDADARAARIDLLAPPFVHGGASTGTAGGQGGEIDVMCAQGDLVIAGSLVASPGSGCASCTNGARGGSVELSGWRIDVDGDIDVRGANVGGDGGTVAIDGTTIDLVGDVLASGGDVPNGVNLRGGQGGWIAIDADVVAVGDLLVRGGALLGAVTNPGGTGGLVHVTARSATIGAIDATAGTVVASTVCSATSGGAVSVRAAETLTVGDVTAEGGACAATASPPDARGGPGGYIELYSPVIVGSPDLRADGGDAVAGTAPGTEAEAGNGGLVEVWGHSGGMLSARGGDASADEAQGGPGGDVITWSDNDATVVISGGNGDGVTTDSYAGNGGSAQIFGANSGNVSAVGGNASGTSPHPGGGGSVEIHGDNAACVDVDGGVGIEEVGRGEVVIDGVDTGTCEAS